MNYILAISIESDVYKSPNLEFRLNDRLLAIIDLNKNHKSEIRTIPKQTIFETWGLVPDETCTLDKGGPTMVKVLHSGKWVFFEIDDQHLLDENTVKVTCENFKTNYNNGFISKMDKCKILDVLFMPKEHFIDVKKIFQHCTSRNILADWMWCTKQRPLGLGNGWPMIPALRQSGSTPLSDSQMIENVGEMHDGHIYKKDVWINQDRQISIIWDKRLTLFRLCDLSDGLDFNHIPLADFKKYCMKKHNDETLVAEEIVMPEPDPSLQPNLVVDAETTYLTIHAPVKILLDEFAKNKYIYED